MFRVIHEHQIGDGIIAFIPVDMMDNTPVWDRTVA
jgi:hypothetical protein